MKKAISIATLAAVLAGSLTSFSMPLSANAAAGNLLTDGSFEESESLSTSSSWTFKNGSSPWYQYGGGQITTDMAAEGERSVIFDKGAIGQRISLESGVSYHLTAQLCAAEETTVKVGFNDGTVSYPNDDPVKRDDISLDSPGEWENISFDFDCTRSQEYVIIFYNDQKVEMHVDNVILTEIKEEEAPEASTERINIQSRTIENGQLIYNLTVSEGTQGTLSAALYTDNGEEPAQTKSLRSTTELMTFAFSLSDGEESGRTEFTLTDKHDSSRPLSLPATDIWNTGKGSSEIHLNYDTYPLYVGNRGSSYEGYGALIDIEAEVSGEYTADDITWSVSDSSVLSMTENETDNSTVSIRAVRTGYASVTAALPDGTNASCYIPVIDNYNRLTTRRIELNTDTLSLSVGGTAQLKPIIYPKDALPDDPVALDASLSWESSDETVAKVSSDGEITAKGAGTAKITIRSGDVGRTASCTVTVTDESIDASGITPAETDVIDVTVGETVQLSADAEGPVTWRSDNTYIADVDDNGLVTTYSNSNVQVVSEDGRDVSEKSGTVKIYATAANGGQVAEYELRVNDSPMEVQSVSVSDKQISIPVGETRTVTAVAAPSIILGSDKNISWSSSDDNIVKIEPDGETVYEAALARITAVSEGTARITASSGGKTDTCEVTVTNGEIKVSNIGIESEKTIDVDEVYQFAPEITAEASNGELIWLDTNENIATIDREGNVMGYAPGTVTVYAVAEDSITEEQAQALRKLKYNTREIGEDNSELEEILSGAVYAECRLTVENPSDYLRNVHVPYEARTENSINILWGRASEVYAGDLSEYRVYCDGEYIGSTVTLGYTANGLAADTEYSFRIEAVKDDGTVAKSDEITARTKPAPTEVINVLDYGARGDGLVTDTYAIQRAINDCEPGGTVWLPGGGHIYYSGALFIKSDITLKVDGVLLGSTDPKDYPNMITRWEGWRKVEQSADEWANTSESLPSNHYQHSSLINAGTYDEGENSEISPFNVHDIIICGEGMINGNGFSLAINEGPNLPSDVERQIKDQSLRGRSILIQNAKDVYIKDITVAYSPSWTIHMLYCDETSIDDINVISLGNGDVGQGTGIDAEGHIRNGDGIDPDSCTHMNIFNSYFRTGDDVITLKSGRNKEGNDLDKPNAYIRITDCHADRSIGGYGLGSETAAGSHDILFQNLSITESNCYGIWYKTNVYRGGLTENIQARDVECGSGELSGGARSSARVNFDYSINSAAQAVNRADEFPVVRYLTYENVGGYGWAGSGRYNYSIEGYNQNGYNIPVSHVVIREPYIRGNLSNQLMNCNDVRIWDIVPYVTWNQTRGTKDVVIDTSGVPEREKPDGIELVYSDFAVVENGDKSWGFETNGTGMDEASVDTSNRSILLTNGDRPTGSEPYTHAYQLKEFGDEVKDAKKLNLIFKYRNTAAKDGTSDNNSGLIFTDSDGQIVFAINGGSNKDDNRKFIYAASNGKKGIEEELSETNGYPTYTPNVFGTAAGGWYYDVNVEFDFTKTTDNVKLVINSLENGSSEVARATLTADGNDLKYFYAVNYGNGKAPQRITEFGIYDISEGTLEPTPAPASTPEATDTPEPAATPEPSGTPETTEKPELVINEKNADESAAYYGLSLSSGENCVVMAASYNEDGSLYAVSCEDTQNGSSYVTLPIPCYGAKVKLMAWKSLESMIPDSNVIEDTASAAEEEIYLLDEDFSDVSDSAWSFNGTNTAKVSANISDVQSSQAAGIESGTVTVLLGADSGGSVERSLGKNISSRSRLNVSFDWQSNIISHSSKPVPRNGFFSLTDDEGRYILSLYSHILDGIKYSLDGRTVEITYKDHDNKNTTQQSFENLVDLDSSSTKWYHIELELDFEQGTVKGIIADRESGDLKAAIDSKTDAKNLSRLYAYNGYSAAPMSLDNIRIKSGGGVDKFSLGSAVEIYSGVDQNDYQEYGIEEFNEALSDASAVLADDGVSQASVNSAYNRLVKAAGELRAKETTENMRTVINENNDWIFVKEKETAAGAETGTMAFEKLDLAEWSGVDLPHTWNAQDGSDGGSDYDRTKGWYRKNMYIDSTHEGKRLYLEFGAAGTSCDVYINGVHVPYANYDIYGMGSNVEYSHKGGFSGFRFDITDYVDYGSNNEVSVLTDNTRVPEIAPLNGDFNCQGGLYRGVKLVITEDAHFDMSDHGSDGVYLTPRKVTGAEDDSNTDFTLEVKTKIVNDSQETKTLIINAALCEPSYFEVPDNEYIREYLRFDPSDMYTEGGAVVREFEPETVTLGSGESFEYVKEITVPSPRLWNGLEDPYRYEVKLSVSENGTVKDELSEFTGFRYYRIPTPEIDEDGNITGGGFYLNGREYTLCGAGKHQDWGRGSDALGYAITEENMVSDAGIMYELGMNSVRLVHYQHSNEEIELYDKLGITVWSEVGVVDEIISPDDSNYERFMNVSMAQMTELIKQQYNHPSVIVWGVGNEIRRELDGSFRTTAGDNANSPELARDYHEQMDELVKGLDPVRPTTYAAFCLFSRSEDWKSDTAAMNLYPYWYTNGMGKWYMNETSMDGIMNADFGFLSCIGSAKPLGISEYGAGGEIGFLRPFETDGTVKPGTSYPDEQYSTTFQAYLHEKIYNEIVNELSWAWCSYVWQLFDSASDKKEGGLPGTNDKGLVSYDHTTKKDAFYFYKANWNDIEPFIHIVESETSDILRVYSNYDNIQLYVNGEPIGEPITDVNESDGVADGLGIFMWYDVPDGEISFEGSLAE